VKPAAFERRSGGQEKLVDGSKTRARLTGRLEGVASMTNPVRLLNLRVQKREWNPNNMKPVSGPICISSKLKGPEGWRLWVPHHVAAILFPSENKRNINYDSYQGFLLLWDVMLSANFLLLLTCCVSHGIMGSVLLELQAKIDSLP